MFTRFWCRPLLLLAVLAGCGSLAGVAASADQEQAQIAVIASNLDSIPKMDEGSLREIYLKRIFVNTEGRPYIPVNLPANHQLRNVFLSAVLKMNASQLQIYWDRRYFQGVSPPYVLGSQMAVVKFVAMTPGAIGYVQRCQVTPEVHVIMLVPQTAMAAADIVEKCPDAAAQ